MYGEVAAYAPIGKPAAVCLERPCRLLISLERKIYRIQRNSTNQPGKAQAQSSCHNNRQVSGPRKRQKSAPFTDYSAVQSPGVRLHPGNYFTREEHRPFAGIKIERFVPEGHSIGAQMCQIRCDNFQVDRAFHPRIGLFALFQETTHPQVAEYERTIGRQAGQTVEERIHPVRQWSGACAFGTQSIREPETVPDNGSRGVKSKAKPD